MRILIGALLVVLATVPAYAQSRSDDQGSRSPTKIIIGAGAIVFGSILAAKSGESTTVSSPLGITETSKFSAPQFGIGLGIAGVGAILLWDGVRSHRSDAPSTSWVISIGRAGKGVFVRRRW